MMHNNTRRLLERYVDGALSADETDALQAAMGSKEAVDAAVGEEMRVARAIAPLAENRFRTGFAGRVMARIATANSEESLADMLARQFPWVLAPASAAGASILAVNIASAAGGATLLEAAAGLPPDLIEAALLFAG